MKEISIKRFGCYILYLLSIHVIALFIFFVFRFTLFCSVDYQFPAEIKSDIVLQSVAFLRGLWFDNVVACYILLLPLVILWILLNGYSRYSRFILFVFIRYLLLSLLPIYHILSIFSKQLTLLFITGSAMLEQQQEWYLVSLHIIFPYSSVFCLL
jgi:hypothetical protein